MVGCNEVMILKNPKTIRLNIHLHYNLSFKHFVRRYGFIEEVHCFMHFIVILIMIIII